MRVRFLLNSYHMRKQINLRKLYLRCEITSNWLVNHHLRPLVIFVNLWLYGGRFLDGLIFTMRMWYAKWTTFDGLSNRSKSR